MTEQYKIVVIGAGPGGISAAAHAEALNLSRVLLEASPKIANTIQKYQKGKHVMAEPGILPLRSPIAFEAGKREAILDVWQQGLLQNKVNIQYNAAVAHIDGQKGDYTITLANGNVIQAEFIILGIGVQGNPRKLDVELASGISSGSTLSLSLGENYSYASIDKEGVSTSYIEPKIFEQGMSSKSTKVNDVQQTVPNEQESPSELDTGRISNEQLSFNDDRRTEAWNPVFNGNMHITDDDTVLLETGITFASHGNNVADGSYLIKTEQWAIV